MDFPDESTIHEHCPEGVRILCGKKTLGRGLCVQEQTDCDVRTSEVRGILDFPENAAGRNYSYANEFLGRGCYVQSQNLTVDYHKTFEIYDRIPDLFSLLTYNIWGLTKNTNLKRLFGLRKKLLLKTLNESSADMFCLQEMSADSYIMMADWIKSYAFASEIPYLNNGTRNRSVDVYFVSRYRPKSITIYGLQGVLNYKNALMVIEYPNLVIYNLYNQAGSKVSIGQEKTWIHYSRCRYDILNIIYDVMPKNQNIAICGDFNFHLDGSEDDWPEIDMINRFKNAGFIDTYRSIHNVGGLTEDTDANPMRWNQKLVSKKYRYDAILYKGSTKGWDVNSSRILGTEKSWLNEADSEWFYNELSEAKKKTNGLQRLKAKRITKKGYRLPINPSDHFGVLTKFKMPTKRWVTRKIQTK